MGAIVPKTTVIREVTVLEKNRGVLAREIACRNTRLVKSRSEKILPCARQISFARMHPHCVFRLVPMKRGQTEATSSTPLSQRLRLHFIAGRAIPCATRASPARRKRISSSTGILLQHRMSPGHRNQAPRSRSAPVGEPAQVSTALSVSCFFSKLENAPRKQVATHFRSRFHEIAQLFVDSHIFRKNFEPRRTTRRTIYQQI